MACVWSLRDEYNVYDLYFEGGISDPRAAERSRDVSNAKSDGAFTVVVTGATGSVPAAPASCATKTNGAKEPILQQVFEEHWLYVSGFAIA